MPELLVGAAMGVGTGALKSLVEKLAAALGDEYKRFKGVRDEIVSLTEELDAMHAFLLEMSKVEDPSKQDKVWTNKVRELSYDMEDSLDEFMIRVDGKPADPHGFKNKCKNLLTKLETRRNVAKEIEKLKVKVKEVAEMDKRYKNPGTISNTSKMDVDKRALAIYHDASKLLVGIDGPKAELIKLLKKNEECASSLKKNEECASSQTKVVSIVGSAGLGKTTLASQVYEALKDGFQCGAIVSVSRTADMMTILRTILSEVSKEQYRNNEAGSIQQLVGKIGEYLKDKRYLIVIDDIWDKNHWDDIFNCAFIRNNKHSRIITTTRLYPVAKACCSSYGDIVHEMKGLDLADSKRLLLERLFGSVDNCPEDLEDISNKILVKCGGVPLAIISIAGLLANKPNPKRKCEWDRVHNSIGRGRLGKNTDIESMMQILSLSYFDLPHHLKTCLLYLSIFPEDAVISKWRLVRRWTAEGFIQEEEEGNTLYELGERYFIELINRNLIQAQEINTHGEVTACQLHDTILDFIVLKSDEENFVTVFGDGYQVHSRRSKVRRLSLHASSKEEVSKLEELDLSHVRSVTVFDYSVEVELPFWSKFGFLRVLDLQGCKQVKSHHLAHIGNLFRLKYLSFRETGVCDLPDQQIRKLQYLETLELKKSNVTILPASVAQLQRLVYLAVDEGVKLPDEARSLTALEDLGCVGISKQSIGFMQELGKLEKLKKVSLFFSSAINANELDVADILVLGKLPALVFLQVLTDESFECRRLTIRGSDGFQSLRQFDFHWSVPMMFEVGAMPALEKLTLKFFFTSLQIDMLLVSNGDLPFGIQHLSCLESVHSLVYYKGKLIRGWIGEKIIQMEKKHSGQGKNMADMIYTLVIATCSLLEAKLRQDPSTGATSARKTTTHNHPMFPKLKLSNGSRGLSCHDEIEECFPEGPMFAIRNILSNVLQCERPDVLGIKDKEHFSTVIRTWLEVAETSDSKSVHLIQDSAYPATIAFLEALQYLHLGVLLLGAVETPQQCGVSGRKSDDSRDAEGLPSRCRAMET